MSQVRREKIQTVFIACEGESEKNFIQFLVGTWGTRYSGYTVRIKSCDGGGLKHMAKKVTRSIIDSEGPCCLLLDQFTVEKERGFQVPKPIELIKSNPCLEAMICQILGSEKTFEGVSEKDCKKYLKEKYGCDEITKKWLEQNIKKEMLEEKEKSIPCLKKLRQILT